VLPAACKPAAQARNRCETTRREQNATSRDTEKRHGEDN